MKEIINKLKGYVNKNGQKTSLFGSVALAMLIIILGIAVATNVVGIKTTYAELEKKLAVSAERYLKQHPESIPNADNKIVKIEAKDLIQAKKIKNLDKYVDDSCDAYVEVSYEENNNYYYQAFLTCSNYKTQKLIDVIKNNTIKTQTGDGLYEMNNELVFRGENPNNYVAFAGELWRIVKIKENHVEIILTDTEDNDIYGCFDNRYNTEVKANYGINNYGLSRALLKTKEIYNSKYSKYSKYLTQFDLCIGKRNDNSTDKSGKLECNELLKKQDIGLLPLYDYMNASLDGLCNKSASMECQNYNYLVEVNSKWWTMTGNLKDTYSSYIVSYNGSVYSEYASSSAVLRYVLSLNSKVLYELGDGSKEDPYKIR